MPRLKSFIAATIFLAATVAASAQLMEVSELLDIPALGKGSSTIELETKANVRSYDVPANPSMTILPETITVWVNNAPLTRDKDYVAVTGENAVYVQLTEPRRSQRDKLRVGFDFRRANLTNGKPFSMDDLYGHVLVVDLWATWCGPCVKEIPDFIEFQKKHKDEKFSYVGISVDDPADLAEVESFISGKQVNYPMILGDRTLVNEFKPIMMGKSLSGIPTKFVVNRQGKVAFWMVGSPKGTPIEPEIERRLLRLIAEPVPEKPKAVSAN